MVINCSRTLYDSLFYPVKIPLAEYDPLYSWYGTAFYDDEYDSFVMLVNEATAFPILVSVGNANISGSFLLEAIRSALLEQGYDSDHVERYIKEGQEVTFTSSNNQNLLARVNKLIKATVAPDSDIVTTAKDLRQQAVTYQKKRIVPSLALGEALETESKEIVRPLHMVVPLHVTLRLTPRFKVYRDFLVPPTITFAHLHAMLQIGFGWDDMHLHRFKINKKTYIGRLSDFLGTLSSNETLIDEREIHLYNLSHAIKSFSYLYDFGDNWLHTIRIGKRVLQAEEPTILCTGGEGDTPWEDCGGTYGYENMVDILADPESEQYEEIKDWVGDDDLQRFNKSLINFSLSKLRL